MSCVHACAAISRINKNPEDFCHHWLTMEAYRATYMHFLNSIPDEKLWKKSEHNRLQAPKIRRRPENFKKKRRKDADEEPSSSKKSKTATKLKRIYKEFTCTYCGVKEHTKRSCAHKKADDIACALAAAAAAVVAKSKSQYGAYTNALDDAATTASIQTVDTPQALEIDITQPTVSQSQIIEHVPSPPPPLTRLDKLPHKRRATPGVEPMQGVSSGTASKFTEFMKFVPNPGFKAPRKK